MMKRSKSRRLRAGASGAAGGAPWRRRAEPRHPARAPSHFTGEDTEAGASDRWPARRGCRASGGGPASASQGGGDGDWQEVRFWRPQPPALPLGVAFWSLVRQQGEAHFAGTKGRPGSCVAGTVDSRCVSVAGEGRPPGSFLSPLCTCSPTGRGLRSGGWRQIQKGLRPRRRHKLREKLRARQTARRGAQPRGVSGRTVWACPGVFARGSDRLCVSCPPLSHHSHYPGRPVTKQGWQLGGGGRGEAPCSRLTQPQPSPEGPVLRAQQGPASLPHLVQARTPSTRLAQLWRHRDTEPQKRPWR